MLAKIDVDANPLLAQAAAVQGIPAVKAIIKGQVVGEFTGAVPEAQVRAWTNDVVKMAAEMGLQPVAGAVVEEEEPTPAYLLEADEALSPATTCRPRSRPSPLSSPPTRATRRPRPASPSSS